MAEPRSECVTIVYLVGEWIEGVFTVRCECRQRDDAERIAKATGQRVVAAEKP